jgi:hypothetical protein
MEIVKGKYYKYNDANSFTVKALDNSTANCFNGFVVLENPTNSWEVGEQSFDWSTRLFVESDLSEFLEEANKRYPMGSQYVCVGGDDLGVKGKGVAIVEHEARLWRYDGDLKGIEMGNFMVYNFKINKWAEPFSNVEPVVELDVEEMEAVEPEIQEVMEEIKTQKLSRQGLKEIHGVACSNWKNTLLEYGRRNPLEDYVEFSQREVEAIFKACTPEQLPIVSKHLKQASIKYLIKGIDDAQLNAVSNRLIKVRVGGEYERASFTLNDSFDWEIKEDSFGYKCLVPTRK